MTTNPKDWKQVEINFDQNKNIVYFDAYETDFVPDYLKYLLEHLKIPADARRVFLKDLKG